ncbi:3-carboxy-cis,cis-muconate cycloisomerase [Mesorhizobium sp. M1C.F.Ca.ET.193.01.1.1]|uniref:3-carboxy-cis,cis-muconate cycloisomerase n=1 Tax=unclassified Mesorhizobium TaxID=325217 RepID=UPI000FD3CC19|nr:MULTISPECIES: 3-carboxy-cis,cis-muconate cycloisomerase [unclassified Mesorhizobium]TGS98957.1 3-carboxy-cis,cis-muconate cycloisomerase [bacterium M00.F.Ca.ET.177.01.1.1]TGQ52995.1 3-carboxy-cis,cis-muconate cycloisomerase [Mesorhizobium sp. M1C.F.Ca.ET.210.01.1.1]TGQ70274.1 3-carboxy-cis,cis-muconate cycloisomerase [Mesorhizobium sp. M1C.F.Ca.ET.212.01.1.1]TGR06603.1 3-carboxy-cis,cis-muconate cycloisomerase [Mesorhizobium sp. M1C.F.Ca.ET.204.01.1.1]TGR27126.1 3-carboxy-cis,cis-muconate c
MTVSPFDHPLLSGLLGDEEAARHFSVEADIDAMLGFERALAEAEAECGVISEDAATAIGSALASFRLDTAKLRAGVARDGVVVPELVRQIQAAVGEPHNAVVHFGATSQDVIDSSLVLRLRGAVDHIGLLLSENIVRLANLEQEFGGRALMATTRMQPAIPMTVQDRIVSWRAPLERHQQRLKEQSSRLFVVQFGGAAGTLEKLGDKAPAVRAALAAKLGLGDAPQWQSQRDALAEFAGWLSLTTGSLGKFGQDIALMAQAGKDIKLSGGGGSSTMPHKQNPVKAEALTGLARFNATQLAGMHQALVHEQERSGAAWTLEWLVLPQMVVATAAALRQAAELAGQIESLGH